MLKIFSEYQFSSAYLQVIKHSSDFLRTFFHLGEDEQFWKKCSDPFPPKLLIYNWKNVCYISTTDLDKNESSFGWFHSCFPLPNLGDFVCLHLVFYYLHWVPFLLSPNFDRGLHVLYKLSCFWENYAKAVYKYFTISVIIMWVSLGVMTNF